MILDGFDEPVRTEAELRNFLNVCQKTMKRSRDDKKIEFEQVNGTILYRDSQIEKFFMQRWADSDLAAMEMSRFLAGQPSIMSGGYGYGNAKGRPNYDQDKHGVKSLFITVHEAALLLAEAFWPPKRVALVFNVKVKKVYGWKKSGLLVPHPNANRYFTKQSIVDMMSQWSPSETKEALDQQLDRLNKEAFLRYISAHCRSLMQADMCKP